MLDCGHWLAETCHTYDQLWASWLDEAAACTKLHATSKRLKMCSHVAGQVKLRGARRADARLAALNQVKQSMAAPDWELDDAEWCAVPPANSHFTGLYVMPALALRTTFTLLTAQLAPSVPEPLCYCRRPTFRPSMKLHHQPPKRPEAAARRATLAAYINALADLAAPKKALTILSDAPRMDAFEAGIRSALQEKPGDCHSAYTAACSQHNARRMLPAVAVATCRRARPGAGGGYGVAAIDDCCRRCGLCHGCGAHPHAVPHGSSGAAARIHTEWPQPAAHTPDHVKALQLSNSVCLFSPGVGSKR